MSVEIKKHDWKRDAKGEIEEFGDEWPYAECRLCGETTSWPVHEEFVEEDCEGLDLSVRVSVSISHPGKATEDDDSAAVAMSEIIPLSVLLSAKQDPVVKAIGDAVEVITGSWRGARTAHESAWRTAVEAAAESSVSAAKAADQ